MRKTLHWIVIGERAGLLALFAAAVLFVGCGWFGRHVHAASAFGGHYLFRASLHTAGGSSAPPFVEGGLLTATNGNFVLVGTFNNLQNGPVTSPNVQVTGTYSLDGSGFGTMTAPGATDALAQNATFYCIEDGSYCTIESAVDGHSWQGKMWRDPSPVTPTSPVTIAGMYIFESDAAQNIFTESGIIQFDGGSKYNLQSTFNTTFPGSHLEPGKVWACGEYTFSGNASGHMTQVICKNRQLVDTMAIYCFFNGSRCLLVPDQNDSSLWLAEMQRR